MGFNPCMLTIGIRKESYLENSFKRGNHYVFISHFSEIWHTWPTFSWHWWKSNGMEQRKRCGLLCIHLLSPGPYIAHSGRSDRLQEFGNPAQRKRQAPVKLETTRRCRHPGMEFSDMGQKWIWNNLPFSYVFKGGYFY